VKLSLAGISVLILFGAVPAATADYQFQFTTTVLNDELVTPSTPFPAISGFFNYDSSLTEDPFSDFTVVFEGFTFDLTASASSPFETGSLSCLGGDTGPEAAFLLLTGGLPGCGEGDDWTALDQTFIFFPNEEPILFGLQTSDCCFNDEAFGTFTTTFAPEPRTPVLMLVGLGLFALAQGLRQWARKTS
jgi:hypothetical protein